MRVEVPGKPTALSRDNGKIGFFLIGLIDRDGVTVLAPFADIRDPENDGPPAGLDRSRKISIARDRRADHNRLRATAAPAPETRWSPKPEVDHGAAILASVVQRNLQPADAPADLELPLEKAFVIGTGQ